jgi:hypothetical protein
VSTHELQGSNSAGLVTISAEFDLVKMVEKEVVGLKLNNMESGFDEEKTTQRPNSLQL